MVLNSQIWIRRSKWKGRVSVSSVCGLAATLGGQYLGPPQPSQLLNTDAHTWNSLHWCLCCLSHQAGWHVLGAAAAGANSASESAGCWKCATLRTRICLGVTWIQSVPAQGLSSLAGESSNLMIGFSHPSTHQFEFIILCPSDMVRAGHCHLETPVHLGSVQKLSKNFTGQPELMNVTTTVPQVF